MQEFDPNGRHRGMTQPQFFEVIDLVKELEFASWMRDLDDPDARPSERQTAEAELAKIVEKFQAFNESQRTFFMHKYRPRPIPLCALAKFIAALTQV